MSKKNMQYLEVVIGLTIAAISFNLFLNPYNLAPGGVSGLVIILKPFLPFNEKILIYVINFFLIFISYHYLGVKSTKKTILGSILYPIMISITSKFTNNYIFEELDFLTISLIGGFLNGIGLGLIYKNGFSSGGTDIINQIVEKKFKMPMSQSMLIVDGFIVLLSAVIYGVPIMVYSIICLYLISYISNKVMLELYQNKTFYIYTTKPKEIKDFLTNNYYYDLTILNAIGGFLEKKKHIYMCCVKAKDYYAIKQTIQYLDPQAFIIITDAYEQKNANYHIRQQNIITRPNKVLKTLD